VKRLNLIVRWILWGTTMPEVQDIFKQYGADYLKQANLPPNVCKAVRAIQNCRTSALGGHLDVCYECGAVKISYNSCRNRHCPKCQALAKEHWVEARNADLLSVPYFHVVFTLPEELASIAFQNQKIIYDLLLKASYETLCELSSDRKYLGAEIGVISILHTWGQSLTLHPHVHMIVPGGGLTKDGKWQNSRKKFFIPVKVLAKLFRGKFLYRLSHEKLVFKGQIADLYDPMKWQALLDTLYSKDWYVYCKSPFKTTFSVLQYLGRYTHRIAISNHRIISVQNGFVSFKWRDYKDNSKEKLMKLSASEFMRRFLLHILPTGFTKIRHYGFLSSAAKKKKLTLCKRLLGMKLRLKPEKLSAIELMKKLTGRDITICQHCGIGKWNVYSNLSPPRVATEYA
jgi:hypothetical protein